MDATLSESESLLRDTVRRFSSNYACHAVADYDKYDSTSTWRELSKAGLLGLRRSNSTDGGASTLDEAIVVESLAHGALAVPYLGGSAFVGALLTAASAPDDTLNRLADGELRCAVAVTRDLNSLWDVSSPSGDAPVAFDSAGAVAALVLDFDEGIRIRAVALGDALQPLDLTRRSHTVDPSCHVDVGSLGGVIDPAELQLTIARFLVFLSADIVGVMEAALETAVSYAKTREQFGVPIATFQAIQHLCADQLVSIEAARSLTEYAAWAIDECSSDEAMLAARSAKAYSSLAGRRVCEAVVQVHGGVAFTWDYMAHVYLKRAITDASAFGNSSVHVDEIASARQLANL